MKNIFCFERKLKWMYLLSVICYLIFSTPAAAYDWRHRNGGGRITFEGFAGTFHGELITDALFRLQLYYTLKNGWNVGSVFAVDGDSRSDNYPTKDAFVYAETERGRVEIGLTESVATKMGLQLPDVGGDSLNSAPFFFEDDFIGITNPRVRGNQYAFRGNVVTTPTKPFQFGFGRTFVPRSTYASSMDAGIRYRDQGGRIKTSVSIGGSYIEKPNGMRFDSFLPRVHADARYQFTAAINVNWGSFLWAATGKIAIDDDPTGFNSEGVQLGTGLSYDFLKWSASLNYIFSNIGIFRDYAPNVSSHTGVFSLRHKITKNFSVWASAGGSFGNIYDDMFITTGIGVKF